MAENTFKGTPGEWGVEDPMDHCLTIVANPEAPVYDWVWVATCDWPDEENHFVTAAQVKANARLIAGAKGLLLACQELDRLSLVIDSAVRFSDSAENSKLVKDALNTARAAITKALGDA